MTRSKEQYEGVRRLYAAQGDTAYILDVFGDYLAQKEGYKSVQGMEAVYLYLVRTYHWKPAEVRSMSVQDIDLALTVEREHWTLPEAARG